VLKWRGVGPTKVTGCVCCAEAAMERSSSEMTIPARGGARNPMRSI
jgi:hypothetical protein